MKQIKLLLFSLLISISAWAQYPLVSIDSIQWVHPDSLAVGNTLSRYEGDTVRVRGLVIYNPRQHALSLNFKASYLVDTASLATNNWKGLLIRMLTPDSVATQFFANFIPGNIVECTGVVAEFKLSQPNSGETQVDLISVATQVVGFATPPPPKQVPVSNFMVFDPNDPVVPQKIQKLTGEQYEGMYVQMNNVFVTGVSVFGGNRIAWLVQDASGSQINVRDVSQWFRPPFASSTASNPSNPNAPVFIQQGKAFEYIRGVITETNFQPPLYPRYEIVPLVQTDLGPVTASPPFTDGFYFAPSAPAIGTPVTVGATIRDLDGSVQSAKLYYTIGINNSVYDSVNMAAAGVDTFTAVIPGSALTTNGEYIKYFIRAIDNQGFSAIAPDTSMSFNVFRVISGGINTLSQIQETPYRNGNSIYAGQRLTNLNIKGVVTATINPNDLGAISFQDSRGPYSGIMLRSDVNGNLDLSNRGDSLRITAATVIENFGITTFTDVQYTLVTNVSVPAPSKISIDSVLARSYEYTEAYESMLTQFDSVYIINQNPDAPGNFGEFLIYPDSASATGLRVRTGPNANGLSSPAFPGNFNIDSLQQNRKLDYIRGILTFNFGNWKLIPRAQSDLAGFGLPGGSSIQSVNNNANILNLYPNPNQGNFTLELQLEKAERLELSIYDMTGRKQSSQIVDGVNGLIQLKMSNERLADGLYFLQIRGKNSASTKRFIVKK